MGSCSPGWCCRPKKRLRPGVFLSAHLRTIQLAISFCCAGVEKPQVCTTTWATNAIVCGAGIQYTSMIQILREMHDTPPNIARTLELAGGTNRFGEPNFRAVWGWNRLAWIGGRWTDLDESGAVLRETIGLRFEPKYIPTDRWHIERWCAPEMYGSPETWARNTLEIENGMNVPALGPYPSRGEYEQVFTLETPTWSGRCPTGCGLQQPRGPKTMSRAPCGEFVQLTPTIAERLPRMIEASRGTPKREGREALYRREAQREKQYDAYADEVLSG